MPSTLKGMPIGCKYVINYVIDLILSSIYKISFSVEIGNMPTLSDLGFNENDIVKKKLKYIGGETEAIKKLNLLISKFKNTKPSTLAPWLAHGCLSPRYVLQLAREKQSHFFTFD